MIRVPGIEHGVTSKKADLKLNELKLGEEKPGYRYGRYGTNGICKFVKVGFIIKRKKCRY